MLWLFAASCAALPVYIHLHPEHFGPPLMTFNGKPESGNYPVKAEQARSEAALLRPRLQLDQITTGSIEPLVKPTGPRTIQMQSQPFPNEEDRQSGSIQFISATPQRALAFVDGRWVILTPGDALPDGRLIARFDQANGKIIPVTIQPPAVQAPSPFSGR
jgi:hypothetical protein